jgi:hypothetical protein
MEVRFPDGTVVRARPLAERNADDGWRTFGLYCDPAWMPDWPAGIIDWPDFGLPADPARAAAQIVAAWERARSGERLEVGCLGGRGRTGTVLACLAILSGVPAAHAVAWVRSTYHPEAVETPEQEAWVQWFADLLESSGGLASSGG